MSQNTIHQFLRRLNYEKNASPNTISAYKQDLFDLYNFLQKDLCEANSSEIFDYIITLRMQTDTHLELQDTSIARKIACFRSFYKDLIRMESISVNPMDNIDTPKLQRKLPATISEDELDKIFTYFNTTIPHDKKIFAQLRDEMIFETLYSCGIRVSELCNLKINHIYQSEATIRILGKGNKERLVPIGTRLDILLTKYLPIRLEYLHGITCDYLITSKFRKQVSRMFIWKVLKKYSLDQNITELHPHMLRHAFATHMLAHGADLRLIQELLGHNNLSTTEIYTFIEKSSLQNTLNQFHPMA